MDKERIKDLAESALGEANDGWEAWRYNGADGYFERIEHLLKLLLEELKTQEKLDAEA